MLIVIAIVIGVPLVLLVLGGFCAVVLSGRISRELGE